MKPRPLSPKRRQEIECWIMPPFDEEADLLDDLISAEQYWREAVKTAPETYRHVEADGQWGGQEFCFFCGGEMANQTVNHKPDCPWLMAQE